MYSYDPKLYIEARDRPREGEVLLVIERVQRLIEARATLTEGLRKVSEI